jgi:hypothetical protein
MMMKMKTSTMMMQRMMQRMTQRMTRMNLRRMILLKLPTKIIIILWMIVSQRREGGQGMRRLVKLLSSITLPSWRGHSSMLSARGAELTSSSCHQDVLSL